MCFKRKGDFEEIKMAWLDGNDEIFFKLYNFLKEILIFCSFKHFGLASSK